MTTGRVRKLSCITLPLAEATLPRPLAGHSEGLSSSRGCRLAKQMRGATGSHLSKLGTCKRHGCGHSKLQDMENLCARSLPRTGRRQFRLCMEAAAWWVRHPSATSVGQQDSSKTSLSPLASSLRTSKRHAKRLEIECPTICYVKPDRAGYAPVVSSSY